ncbi:type I 3-dehydroquinate dehydratase [Halobellus limi]|jgi:3-dehydroquinate dehydratase-1|uniref:3-dehydroquinate dehydratase n=2 Tax=Halobellus limi TaxID=699433 RepID=A0A1H5ZM31_9EURY|nr:type I 3-dehydroquinate dehydratase [Halobellus limi]QCC48057.1 type I 3-dehydroquinate dehydratase [Halobellus limi]SEG36825.1 3-dehydroquinate dehydratase [Halobellus limi]
MNIDGFTLAATTNDLTREEKARGKADVIEFRMDKAEDPIGQLEAYDGELPIVATNRNQWFGGKARDTGRLDTLFAASRFDSVAYVDIELETARAKEWILEEFRDNDVGLIISHHDFDTTPEKEVLTAIIDQCAGYGDVAKVAVYPEDLSDTLTLLTALHEATQAGIDAAGIAMGETGSHTRVVGHIYGSKLGYAPLLDDDSEYAPGQIPLGKLRALVEATRIDGTQLERIEAIEGDVAVPSELTLPN